MAGDGVETANYHYVKTFSAVGHLVEWISLSVDERIGCKNNLTIIGCILYFTSEIHIVDNEAEYQQ